VNQSNHDCTDQAATMETYVTLVNKIQRLLVLLTKPDYRVKVIHQANNCNESNQSHHMNIGNCGNLGNYVTVSNQTGQIFLVDIYLTLILLTWTIWRAPTNACKWRMGYNSAFKGLRDFFLIQF
jgi:hypothetical protein